MVELSLMVRYDLLTFTKESEDRTRAPRQNFVPVNDLEPKLYILMISSE